MSIRPGPSALLTPSRTASVALLAVATLAGALTGCGGGANATGAGSPDPQPVAPNAVGDTVHLDPAMRRSVDHAVSAARAAGVSLRVTSGWRSRTHQQQLYDEAIQKYGSPAKARSWVLPPEESAHVKGSAVDVGPASGAIWLEEHGVGFGLCRRYDNEPWHFERLAGATGSVCPPREPHA